MKHQNELTAEGLWDEVAGRLGEALNEATFSTWFAGAKGVELTDETFTLTIPNDFTREWIEGHFLGLIKAAVKDATGQEHRVSLSVRNDGAATEPVVGANEARPLHRPEPEPVTGMSQKYTFDLFVIGSSNRFAHAAALAVAEAPAQAYNPLFIYGQPGLGKTHLLHAIGNYLSRYGSGLQVRYATLEEFTTDFVRAVRSREMEAFKRRFRGVDVLLLDDVQFLTDKARTEEELFHTFNVLHDSGRQLVLTSDRSPTDLAGLEQRLGDRFASGLVATLEAPDVSVRRAILEKRARLDAVDVDPNLLEEIAAGVTTSVRALEAALIKVVAYASLRSEPATPALARRLLDRPSTNEPCSVAAILHATATAFAVPRDTLLARDRRPPVARARKVAMYLTRELLGQSLPEIGRAFGGRDHTTVLSAVRGVSRELERDPTFAIAVDNLRAQLLPRP